jgi:RNA polymerase sigma-70 factor (ECF subfamily)
VKWIRREAETVKSKTLSASSAASTERADSPARPRQEASDLAVEEIYREHHEFVWRTIVRFGVDAPAADDAVQEVFLAMARRLHEFEGRSSMRTWLFAIAMRVAQRLRRTESRHRRRVEAYERSEPAGSEDPYARSDAAQLLHRLLAELDDDRRAVYILAELEGMTAPEIGAMLGVKVPTVYTRLRAARRSMEDALAAFHGAEVQR